MKKKRGRPRKKEEDMLKQPIKTLRDIPQELKPKKKIGFWAWLFPKIWK